VLISNHDKVHEISKFRKQKKRKLEARKLKRTVPSANAEITFPSADNDLLIFFASSST
jgi:hypothetical protein